MMGFIGRKDFVMAPRSFLRPEFIAYASNIQEASNPYDINTAANKLEKISKRCSGNKFQRDYEFHDTLNNFLERRQEGHDTPIPTSLKAKPTKNSKHYEDVTRKTTFQDAYSGTLAALRKVKQETLAEEATHTPSSAASTASGHQHRQARVRKKRTHPQRKRYIVNSKCVESSKKPKTKRQQATTNNPPTHPRQPAPEQNTDKAVAVTSLSLYLTQHQRYTLCKNKEYNKKHFLTVSLLLLPCSFT